METIALTDDELISLGADQQAAWPGGLPTIDRDSPQDVIAAVTRGRRSLAVRDLIDDRGEPTREILRTIGNVADGPGFLETAITDGEFLRGSWDLAFRFFPIDGDWLAEEISESGVHRFSFDQWGGVETFLTRFLNRMLLDGADQGPDVRRCCVVAATPRSDVVVSAREGRLGLITRSHEAPPGAVTREIPVAGVGEALAVLLAAMVGPGGNGPS